MRNFVFKYYIGIILLVLLAYTAKINWGSGQWENVIEADAKGYYAYLPAIFIYEDLNFGFYEKVEVEQAYDKTLVYDYRAGYNDRIINKYYVGESVLLLPFFLLAHILSIILGYPADGFSQIYVIAVSIAAVFYLSLGLFYLRKTLRLFEIEKTSVLVSILAIVFGTNLFYYTIGEAGMSHVFSFSMVSIFFYYVKRYFHSFATKNVLYASFFFGLIVLLRPVNGIIIFALPFLSPDYKTFMDRFKLFLLRFKLLLFSALIVFAVISIQLIIYKIQTGSFWVYSYGEEGFNFLDPHIIEFLFSYKKGFFLYTPIAMITLFGFLFTTKKNYFRLTAIVFFSVVVFILSSWWNWYYGGSFSSRVMVEYLPFFAIMLGVFLNGISSFAIKKMIFVLLFLAIIINQIQTLQYRYYVIHWSEMDREKYWDVFLDIDPIMERKEELKKSPNKIDK